MAIPHSLLIIFLCVNCNFFCLFTWWTRHVAIFFLFRFRVDLTSFLYFSTSTSCSYYLYLWSVPGVLYFIDLSKCSSVHDRCGTTVMRLNARSCFVLCFILHFSHDVPELMLWHHSSSNTLIYIYVRDLQSALHISLKQFLTM